MLAGLFLIEEELISDGAKRRVREWINERVHSDYETLPSGRDITFDEFRNTITKELRNQASEVHELGHDVIFSAYVLKALQHFDIKPWESLMISMCELIQSIKNSTPGWITINGENQRRNLETEDQTLPNDYWGAFASLDRFAEMEAGDMQLGHILTHGHAIKMLHVNGKLTQQFNRAFSKRLHGLISANNDQKSGTPLMKKYLDPREESFWEHMKEHGDSHVLKYAYSFLSLRQKELKAEDFPTFGRIMWPNKSI